MTKAHSKEVEVYYDNRHGVEPGWVSRCTEFDEDGQSILGRACMDEPAEYADSADEAVEFAANWWGVKAEDVYVLED